MLLTDLPPELLAQIFFYCNPGYIAEICQRFSRIAYHTPELWTSIMLGSRQMLANTILCQRLQRSGVLPLDVFISSMGSTPLGDLLRICSVLAEQRTRIRTFVIEGETVTTAMIIVRNTMFSLLRITFLILEELRIVTHQNISFVTTEEDIVPFLHELPVLCPRLRFLSIPPLIRSASQSNQFVCDTITVLVIDGSALLIPPSLFIWSLLECLPNLDTLWVKCSDQHMVTASFNPNPIPEIKRSTISLPHLVSLSVSVVGLGCDLISGINAPALQALHLDGSFTCFGQQEWTDELMFEVESRVRDLALQSKELCRLAVTNVCLSHSFWTWLLTSNIAPFPKLESIAVHEQDTERHPNISSHLDDGVFHAYLRAPSIALRRFSMTNCFRMDISGNILLNVAKAAMKYRDTRFQLVLIGTDISIDLEQFLQAGVDVRVSEKLENHVQWWWLAELIDPSDSSSF